MPELPNLPPTADEPLSVILLAYNDAPHLDAVLSAWSKQLNDLGRAYEILLVDDGSADGTGSLAESMKDRYPLLHVTRHEKSAGIGAALRTGIAQAKYPLLFYTTADDQYQPGDLPLLLKEIEKVHLVPGYRRWQKVPLPIRLLGGAYRILSKILFDLSPTPLPGWLGWREHLYHALIRVLFGVRTLDLNCFYLICRREIFTHLPIQSDGPFVQTEILAKANFLACLIAEEVPISHRPRPSDGRAPRWRADGYLVFSNPDFSATTPTTPIMPNEKDSTVPASG